MRVVGDDEAVAHMRRMIAQYGYGVQAVSQSGRLLLWYTFGLTGGGLAELLIAGVGVRNGKAIMDAAVDQHLGRSLTPGEYIRLDCLAMPVRVIEAVAAPVKIAWHIYGRENVRALQLLWAADNGAYPDELDWPSDMVQPVYNVIPLPEPLDRG